MEESISFATIVGFVLVHPNTPMCHLSPVTSLLFDVVSRQMKYLVCQRLLVGVLLAVVVSCVLGRESSKPLRTSMYTLIAIPERNDGKLVEVSGYLAIHNASLVVFVDEDAPHSGEPLLSLELRGRHEALSSACEAWCYRMVRVVGTFRAPGHTSTQGERAGVLEVDEVAPIGRLAIDIDDRSVPQIYEPRTVENER